MTGPRVAANLRVDLQAEVRQWRAAAALLVGCVILGVLQAILWSTVAPGEQFKVFTDGGSGALPTESSHQFTSIAIFILLGLVAGVCIGVGAWKWRSTRGMVMVLILALANTVGALTAYLLGRVLADGVDPSSVGASPTESIVRAAPVLGSVIVVVVQPALAVAVYTFLAAWSGQADLGRDDLRVEPAAPADPLSGRDQRSDPVTDPSIPTLLPVAGTPRTDP